jgi:hypothetical protein
VKPSGNITLCSNWSVDSSQPALPASTLLHPDE